MFAWAGPVCLFVWVCPCLRVCSLAHVCLGWPSVSIRVGVSLILLVPGVTLIPVFPLESHFLQDPDLSLLPVLREMMDHLIMECGI